MSEYLVVRDNFNVIKKPFIKGNTGSGALNTETPTHMIGLIKRVRAFEYADFILQRVSHHVGSYQAVGPRLGYKYHHPRITRSACNGI